MRERTIDATGLVEVREGGQISSSTFGAGDAGEVTVEAGRVLVDAQDFGEGGSTFFSTSIGAQAGGRAGDISGPRGEDLGNAGRVTINAAERVDVRNGGVITSLSVGHDAGEVTVTAPVVLIDGAGSTFRTGITSEVGAGSIGNAGIVTVNAPEELEIRNSGENRNRGESSISSSTFAKADAGDVVVEAGRLLINGIPEKFTGIASQANKGSGGNAGRVTVIAETMEVHNGGDVASSSFAEGRAGDVVVRVPQLVVRDDGVIASSGSTGPAGNVRLEVDSLLVINAKIRTVGTGATGGEIVVEADDLIHLVKAEVTSDGIEPGARASLITLTAPQIVLNDSRVTSLTGAGEPLGGSGEARLLGDTTVISTDSEVAASSTVEITGQEADLGSQLVILEGTFIDTAPLRERCGARRDIGASSFTGVGRGGLPPSPDGPLASAYVVDEAAVAEAQKAGSRRTAGIAPTNVRLVGLRAPPCVPLD